MSYTSIDHAVQEYKKLYITEEDSRFYTTVHGEYKNKGVLVQKYQAVNQYRDSEIVDTRFFCKGLIYNKKNEVVGTYQELN